MDDHMFEEERVKKLEKLVAKIRISCKANTEKYEKKIEQLKKEAEATIETLKGENEKLMETIKKYEDQIFNIYIILFPSNTWIDARQAMGKIVEQILKKREK